MTLVHGELRLINDIHTLAGEPVRSRLVTEFLACPDVVIVQLPQWIVDDLELKSYVAWSEPDHDVVRYTLTAEYGGRSTTATARLGTGDLPVLDRLAMMMLGLELDDGTGQLKLLPEPYLHL